MNTVFLLIGFAINFQSYNKMFVKMTTTYCQNGNCVLSKKRYIVEAAVYN